MSEFPPSSDAVELSIVDGEVKLYCLICAERLPDRVVYLNDALAAWRRHREAEAERRAARGAPGLVYTEGIVFDGENTGEVVDWLRRHDIVARADGRGVLWAGSKPRVVAANSLLEISGEEGNEHLDIRPVERLSDVVHFARGGSMLHALHTIGGARGTENLSEVTCPTCLGIAYDGKDAPERHPADVVLSRALERIATLELTVEDLRRRLPGSPSDPRAE